MRRLSSSVVLHVMAGAKKGSPLWSLVGLELETGKDALVFEFYKKNRNDNFFANPFYAGVEVRWHSSQQAGIHPPHTRKANGIAKGDMTPPANARHAIAHACPAY